MSNALLEALKEIHDDADHIDKLNITEYVDPMLADTDVTQFVAIMKADAKAIKARAKKAIKGARLTTVRRGSPDVNMPRTRRESIRNKIAELANHGWLSGREHATDTAGIYPE